AVVVVDAAPLRLEAVLFVRQAGIDELKARNLAAVVEVVCDVEDRIVGGHVHDRAIGKYLPHAFDEARPLATAMEVVDHEEAAAQSIIAQPLRFYFTEIPAADLDRIDPGIIEEPFIHHSETDAVSRGLDAREASHA